MSFSEADLKKVLTEIFEERSHIDSKSHGEHHEWIRERIEAEKARKEMYWVIAKAAAQWSIPILLGSLFLWLKTVVHFGKDI